MPLLKFRCKACGKVFDELVRLSDVESQRCPDCGEKAERAYEGKCACSGNSGCGGNCSCCGGCNH
ncbi:MAG: FmdB family zinc ribbon protein [Clostridia bacterium]